MINKFIALSFCVLIVSPSIANTNEIEKDSIEVRNNLLELSLARFIKTDYTNWDSLKTDTEHGFCVMMDTKSNLFTGIAYKIEYGKNFWFLNEGGQNNDVRLKIISFVKGLRNGVALVIDPLDAFHFLSPHTELENMEGELNSEVGYQEMIRMQTFNDALVSEVKKDVIFKFQDFEEEYFDMSSMIRFENAEYFSIDSTKLSDFEDKKIYFDDLEIDDVFGYDDLMASVAYEGYKNKYLRITLTSGYGRTAEQYGHYETDHSRLYFEIPPYDCGTKITISNVEILQNFHPMKK